MGQFLDNNGLQYIADNYSLWNVNNLAKVYMINFGGRENPPLPAPPEYYYICDDDFFTDKNTVRVVRFSDEVNREKIYLVDEGRTKKWELNNIRRSLKIGRTYQLIRTGKTDAEQTEITQTWKINEHYLDNNPHDITKATLGIDGCVFIDKESLLYSTDVGIGTTYDWYSEQTYFICEHSEDKLRGDSSGDVISIYIPQEANGRYSIELYREYDGCPPQYDSLSIVLMSDTPFKKGKYLFYPVSHGYYDYAWKTIPSVNNFSNSDLPEVTSSNNGQFLCVVNGKWSPVKIDTGGTF